MALEMVSEADNLWKSIWAPVGAESPAFWAKIWPGKGPKSTISGSTPPLLPSGLPVPGAVKGVSSATQGLSDPA